MTEVFKGEWRRGVFRQVLRRRDVVVKRFWIPSSLKLRLRWLLRKPDWVREHEAFLRLGAPEVFGLRERRVPGGNGARLVVFRRAFVEGTPVEQLDPVALAQCLVKMHARGVVGLDPHPGNFLLPAAGGELCMIDLGRAVCGRPGSWRLLRHVGHELYRVRRQGWNDRLDRQTAEDFYHAFVQAYRAERPEGWWLVKFSAGVCHATRRLRLRV